MSVMSPEGQKRAQTFTINEMHRSRDQSIGLRGEAQRYQDEVSRDDRLGAELDKEAGKHDAVPMLSEPHHIALLPPAHEEDAQAWEDHRRREEQGLDGSTE